VWQEWNPTTERWEGMDLSHPGRALNRGDIDLNLITAKEATRHLHPRLPQRGMG